MMYRIRQVNRIPGNCCYVKEAEKQTVLNRRKDYEREKGKIDQKIPRWTTLKISWNKEAIQWLLSESLAWEGKE